MKTRIYAALLPLFTCTSLLAQNPAPLFSDGINNWSLQNSEASSFLVQLNGELVTEAMGLENLQGYLGFQSEKGVVEFRNLLIHEY